MSDLRPLFDAPVAWGDHPARVLVYGPLLDDLLDVTVVETRDPVMVAAKVRGGAIVRRLQARPPEVLFVGCFRPSDRLVSVPWKVLGRSLKWSKNGALDAAVAQALKEFVS